MRSKDTESSTATYIVIGLLIAATIIPLATWYFLNNREYMKKKILVLEMIFPISFSLQEVQRVAELQVSSKKSKKAIICCLIRKQ